MMIRKAVSLDAPSIGKIYVDSWKTTYRDIVSAAFLEGLNPSSSAKKFEKEILDGSESRFSYVAEAQKTVVGFALGGSQRGKTEPGMGEIYDIYLLRDFQGQGVGRELLAACASELLGKGFSKMCLLVPAENPYQRFYESAGGVLEPYDGDIEIGAKRFKLLKYVWHLKKNKVST